MIRCGKGGMTLIELIISITILGIIASGATALLSISLQAHAYGNRKSAIYREGLLAMERMTSHVRNTTFLFRPNNHEPMCKSITLSDLVNDDGDFYFNDPIFPRIDEDVGENITGDFRTGIIGIDDDGDGSTDEDSFTIPGDDDEDGIENEDPLDGTDNDGDGIIDEDPGNDQNNDGVDGIKDIDDDGDGFVDEGGALGNKDNDEDGQEAEDPAHVTNYWFDSSSNTLWQINVSPSWGLIPPAAKWYPLSKNVTAFTASYDPPDATHDPRISITLTLTGDDGESITFSEYVYPRNIIQKTGKKVR